ncbi:MAG: XRE family transcriptional regulator [Rhodoferax sp.]|uniref:ImmA/IrrE family metallo-endopeptidase n=1 Tax=Rhodoferax sp. TaxID=50421 RepID=UPI003BB1F1D2
MSAKAHINPKILRWMRERGGLDVGDAARVAGISLDQLALWETGESQPTFLQAQKLAQALHAPFGYLFLTEPPVENLPLPDLRTVGSAPVPRPSVDLLDTIRLSLQRQAWYLDHLHDQDAEPLTFVARFATDAAVRAVAADMRAVLGIDVENGQRTWEVYFRQLVEAAEAAGILVMRSGIVGNNTHRPLDVAEFRGFAVSHPLAPFVFINSADAPSARLFTLIHELAHIWVGSSGISNASPGNTRREEIFCNAVAGEFLAPHDVFTPLWSASTAGLPERVAELAQRFHVSRLVIMRRAFDLDLVDHATYLQHYQAELAAFRNKPGGGGNFYRNANAKNSKRFARAVLAEALSGRLLLRDAGRLLGVQPGKLKVLAGELEQ